MQFRIMNSRFGDRSYYFLMPLQVEAKCIGEKKMNLDLPLPNVLAIKMIQPLSGERGIG
jgi:hypothetical protein